MVPVMADRLTYFLVCDKGACLFCAAFELAMPEWIIANPKGGVDLGNKMLLRFAASFLEGTNLLDGFVRHLAGGASDAEHFKDSGIHNGGTTTFLHLLAPKFGTTPWPRHFLGHTASDKWLGLHAVRLPFTTTKAFENQTSTALFRSNCFFHSLLRCKAPAAIQKTLAQIWRSIPKFVALWGVLRHELVSAMACFFAWVENACGSLSPCQWNFHLVREVYDSILALQFSHCGFSCRTLGGQSTCVKSTSNLTLPWAPTTNLGHQTGYVLHRKLLGELRSDRMLCLGLSRISVRMLLPRFLKNRPQVVQQLVRTHISYICFSFIPPLHWVRLRALGLNWLDLKNSSI